MTALPKNLADRADALIYGVMDAIDREPPDVAKRLQRAVAEDRYRLVSDGSGRVVVTFPDEDRTIDVQLMRPRGDA